jgi:hypothetical protein
MTTGGRAVAAGLGLLSVVTLATDTDARPRPHQFYAFRARAADQATHSIPADKHTGRGPFGALIEQIVRDCSREVAELKSFPLDAISQSINPDDAQDAALKSIRSMAGATADTLAQSCSEQIPPAPVLRLDTVDRGLDAVQAALNTLQSPLQSFYQSLQEEQKARVIVKYIIARGEIALFDTTSVAKVRSGGVGGAGGGGSGSTESSKAAAPAPRVWSCEQLEAGLRAWPIMKIEQAVQPWPRQYSAFYALASSVHHAADVIAESCPKDAALTPTGRLDEVRKKLDAVRQLTTTIRPALTHFYEQLDDRQKPRFVEVM